MKNKHGFVELCFVAPDGRIVGVWFFKKLKSSRVPAMYIIRGLELAGAEYLGVL